jgi:aspartokinase/homoserine dehydrogenase 1
VFDLAETKISVALLGVGNVGRELVRRTWENPEFIHVALGDTSGVITKKEGFTRRELQGILELKESKGCLRDYEDEYIFYEDMIGTLRECSPNVVADVSSSQTYNVLWEALDGSHVITSNKIPIADVSYHEYGRLLSRASEFGRVLDIGTTAGAGLRIPDLVLGVSSDGIDSFTGCLSGTMNYVSCRMNEGRSLSTAVREAMEPPRNYAEPDPRVDLGGDDFSRKIVILTRLCGVGIERSMVDVENFLPDHLMGLPVEEFLMRMHELDPEFQKRIRKANRGGCVLWYLGRANMVNKSYTVGFEEISMGDPISRARESDNTVTISPRDWRRPVTIIGPGSGPPETVTGLISGLFRVRDAVHNNIISVDCARAG